MTTLHNKKVALLSQLHPIFGLLPLSLSSLSSVGCKTKSGAHLRPWLNIFEWKGSKGKVRGSRASLPSADNVMQTIA